MKDILKSLSENVSEECFRDIVEEIINEVSVKRWKEAAKNSIEGRKQAASDASDRFGSVVYPFRPEVNDPGNKLGNAWDKAEQRADRAEQLAKNLQDSNRPANQLKQAAKKVVDKRDKDNEGALDNLQKAYDKYIEKQFHDDEDRKEIIKTQHNWVEKQEKENKARNLVGKPERRPEKNSEGKHKLKEQGYIDRSNEALSEAKPKDPEGYKKNIEIANHYDHLYSTSPAKSPDGSPNSVAAEWNRRYQEYFDKAMKCYYGDGSKEKKAKNPKVTKESLQETLDKMMAVAEDVFTAIDKKYPKDSQRKRELNYDASINKSSEEGDSRWREEQLPYDIWHYKRYETKNSQGDYKNRLRKDEQLRKKLDEFDAKSEKIKNKLDRKREKIKNKVDKNLDAISGENIDYESAIKKSIERKKKKSVKGQ